MKNLIYKSMLLSLAIFVFSCDNDDNDNDNGGNTVSYTHLTLPTNRDV